ncbi:hypothetical protein KIV56_14495 [Cryobacterium breve]|uniref:Lipoprotein LpqB N-terminal domain-containing protein n=1 Tax=Cryobacterium breve TaxID=1259258 RepID=A0ABY7NB61_9MICO|nr:hypothetical protein [Cryobacterium breve]WBM79524.1 hypothetical protein KIV56_14495 [Cryobacterium breve]
MTDRSGGIRRATRDTRATRRGGLGRAGGTLAALLVLAVLLSGCSGIPRSGSVRTGQAVSAGDNPAPVFLPSHPQADASQESILRGFIDAQTSPENDYAIAREFLAPGFSGAWAADAGVTVDDGTARTIVPVDGQTMQFSVNPIADVDGIGEYHEVESPSPVVLRYQFQKVGDQWRISAAPNGTVVDQTTFTDVFRLPGPLLLRLELRVPGARPALVPARGRHPHQDRQRRVARAEPVAGRGRRHRVPRRNKAHSGCRAGRVARCKGRPQRRSPERGQGHPAADAGAGS